MNVREQLDWYTVKLTVPTRQADVDHQGHVNHITMLGLHAEARMMWHCELLGIADPLALARELGAIQARQFRCTYLSSAHYPASLTVGLRLLDVGQDGYRVATGAFQGGRCTSQQECTLGYRSAQGWKPLPYDLQACLTQRLPAGAD